ncbi:antifreeze protein [Athelia psychrophila]|uniref:Antifreeze protein n=1 Tax=Athelia psychrophila TaxID=1759441 RepID=A0A166SSH5_9AGAM|nr:antifreeze protein [Fibularhizoctonia sp. CBS 109695]
MSSIAIAVLFLSNSCLAAGPLAVPLGRAGHYAILAQSGISTVPDSVITGNIGVSPIASAAMTGFDLTLSASGKHSHSKQVHGKCYGADHASPIPAHLHTAVSDMQTAYTNASTRGNPDGSEVGGGVIGGHAFTPGFYKWASTVNIDSSITLIGDATDTWIFQIGGTLDMASAQSVVLQGGARPANIVWAVAGAVTLGSKSAFEGIILAAAGITMQTGSSVNGRLLAQTAVALQMATVTRP